MPRDHGDVFESFSRFTLDLGFDDIPEDVIAYAEDLFLDVIGVSAAARATDAGRIAREIAVTQFAPAGDGEAARILFDGRKAGLIGAAFAGATQIDNFDGHDGYAPNKGHIAVALLPALMAYSEAGGSITGRDALLYFVQGYEVASRAGAALHATVSDYHTSGAWNTLAVAAMGARMRGLDPERLRQAVGIAEYHGPRSQMMREVDNPSMLHDGSGWGALAGVTAALIAEKGFTGAPAITIEGADAAPFWADLGDKWYTADQYIKPYPICRWAHAAIDAALRLREEHGISVNDIAAIEIATFHESSRLSSRMPTDTAEAQYSLAFPVAAAFLRGRVGPDEVLGSGLGDAVIAALIVNTTVSEKDLYNDRFPEGRWGDVTVELYDGRRLNSGPLNARGGPDARIERDEVVEKFHRFADAEIGIASADRIGELVYALKSDDGAFQDLADVILSAPRRP